MKWSFFSRFEIPGFHWLSAFRPELPWPRQLQKQQLKRTTYRGAKYWDSMRVCKFLADQNLLDGWKWWIHIYSSLITINICCEMRMSEKNPHICSFADPYRPKQKAERSQRSQRRCSMGTSALLVSNLYIQYRLLWQSFRLYAFTTRVCVDLATWCAYLLPWSSFKVVTATCRLQNWTELLMMIVKTMKELQKDLQNRIPSRHSTNIPVGKLRKSPACFVRNFRPWLSDRWHRRSRASFSWVAASGSWNHHMLRHAFRLPHHPVVILSIPCHPCLWVNYHPDMSTVPCRMLLQVDM